jgi:hypothetical protein
MKTPVYQTVPKAEWLRYFFPSNPRITYVASSRSTAEVGTLYLKTPGGKFEAAVQKPTTPRYAPVVQAPPKRSAVATLKARKPAPAPAPDADATE